MKHHGVFRSTAQAELPQMRALYAALFLLSALSIAVRLANAAAPQFEDLGETLRAHEMSLPLVTRDPDGHWMAWGSHAAVDRRALVGVRTDNGAITYVDIARFGGGHILMWSAANGNLYAYSGGPGHFLKYDVTRRELIDLGVPGQPAGYWMGSATGPDGRIYVGTTPKTLLVRCDPRSDKIDNVGPIATDPRQSYLLYPAVSDDNVVYCPVGLHHAELWAVYPDRGEKRQILPDAMTGEPGMPRVWTAKDGKVYGKLGTHEFACFPDRIEPGKTLPARYSASAAAGNQRVVGIKDGQLVLADVKTRKQTLVPTHYEGRPVNLYSVTCQRDGRVYGGTVSPASSFAFDTHTAKITNLGRLSSGLVQVYDTLSHPKGLFLSSYTEGHVDFYDPTQPIATGKNPRPIACLAKLCQQERLVQMVVGPDGNVYAGSLPIKGHLGGALVRIDAEDLSVATWRDVIPHQSLLGLVSLPETGELLCGTSIGGGSSAIPTEKQACVFLWDVKQQKVTCRAQPLPDVPGYQSLARSSAGVVYGFANSKYFAFDPRARKVLFTGELPFKTLHYPGPRGASVGRRGLIYGIADDALFAIDPVNHGVQIVAHHPSLESTFGYFVTDEGDLYYGSNAHLMRCRLADLR